MANTYTQIYIHTVFAVRHRLNLILPAHSEEIRKYMTGVVTNLGSKLIAINNMPDHFHLLIGLQPEISLSELIGKVKSGSSGFINQQRLAPGRFEWQKGFGAFSYARSQLDTVIGYVDRQQEHHRKKTFMEEYLALLAEYGIDYDQRYILKEPE
ncbi:MAG: IS200/IS605 family transposase [Candidatus Edwardsbacteria bacterium]|nr:IS200/IS605 family transposase [Candidatus Edwardsbacteria bacterium]MBU1577117.1 IS200/IS605 family transposase [Candidatus Edwardsbacteria bacterium]MBU2463805.1 IS200/IS605 family transposase [Candidatus Edwardsbacteria bacterium]MBU2593787.1 IS200/IS605 family transposase [Candidatus Edwardsbacteria bacterium]